METTGKPTAYKYYNRKAEQYEILMGWMVASAGSTPFNGRQTYLDLIKLAGGGYKLVTLGLSTVYHSGVNPCHMSDGRTSGVKTAKENQEAVTPCQKCHPERDPKSLGYIYEEVPFVHMTFVNTQEALTRALKHRAKTSSREFLSNLSKELLRIVNEKGGI